MYGPILVDIHSHNPVESENIFKVFNHRIGFDPETKAWQGYFSAGHHPWDVKNLDETKKNLKLLENMAASPKFIFIGETGLDRHRDANFEAQLVSFEAHLELAKQYKKPLILHAVKAHSDILHLLKKHHYRGILILHDFSGNTETVKQYQQYETYFSFGQSLFNPRPKLGEVFQSLSLDEIFLETDDQCHLTLGEIYQRASELRACSFDELKQTLWKNLQRVVLSGTGL